LSGVAAAPAINNRSAVSVDTFRAPLFERILNAEESARRQVVLDLGGPCQTLIDRFADTRPTRVEIADLVGYGALSRLRLIESDEEAGPPDWRQFLPAPSLEPIDLILCWDLPNYMQLSSFTALCALLGRRAAPGCQLHMLIAYAKRDMPARPAQFTVREDGQLMHAVAADDMVPAPRYSPEALGAAVGGFKYERGVLLTNGNQEFVYAWPGQPGV